MSSNLALLCLRIGLGTVFCLFGFDKVMNPQQWIIYVPNYLSSMHLSVDQILRLQGIVEFLIGLHFFAGLFNRMIAFFSAGILALIVYTIGLDQAGIRDVGLLSATISLGLLGPGDWSLDFQLKRMGIFNDKE